MSNELNQQLHILLADLTVLHTEINKRILSQYGLRKVRYHSLHHLYCQPDLTLGELSEMTLVNKASSSRMVHSMEKDGLVQRRPDEADRRLFRLSLTANGRALYEAVRADLDADIQKRFEALDEETKSQLLALNQHLKAALQAHDQWQLEADGGEG